MAQIGSQIPRAQPQANRWQLPPKPLALDVAYRKHQGIAGLVRQSGSAGKPTHVLARHPELVASAQDTEPVRQYADQTIDYVLHGSSVPAFPSHAPWGPDAMLIALNRIAQRWAEGELSAGQYRSAVNILTLRRQRTRFRDMECFTPAMLATEDVHFSQRYAWGQHIQFSTLTGMEKFLTARDYHAAYDLLRQYLYDMQAGGLYLDATPAQHGRCHFASAGANALEGALRAISVSWEGVECWVAPQRDEAFAFADTYDVMALRLWPFTPVGEVRKGALMQLIEANTRMRPDESTPADVLRTWGRSSQIVLEDMVHQAPRLTHDRQPSMHAIEHMVHVATVALRDCNDDRAALAQVADETYRLLARDDVYPHLQFFHSTWIAMGVMAEAMRWDGSWFPSFTRALGGLGALHRAQRQQSAVPVWVLHQRALDPLRLLKSMPVTVWERVMAYIKSAESQGFFHADAAERMQHAVAITIPNPRAHAVIVHGGGEDAP